VSLLGDEEEQLSSSTGRKSNSVRGNSMWANTSDSLWPGTVCWEKLMVGDGKWLGGGEAGS
jgi:hypothetical protein